MERVKLTLIKEKNVITILYRLVKFAALGVVSVPQEAK
jgi:hypothetical protein